MLIFQNIEEEYKDVMKDNRTLEEIEKETGETAPLTSEQCISCSERWAMYAYLRYFEEKKDVVYAAAFAYYISIIMTDMGISAQAESMYFTLRLEDKIIELAQKYNNNKEECFNKVLEFFISDEVAKYEKKIYSYTVRLSEENYNKIAEHENKSAYIEELIEKNQVHEKISNDNPVKQMNFVLTYSMSKKLDKIDAESTIDKLLHLL